MRAFAALLLFEFGRRRMLLLAGALLGALACVLPGLVSTSRAADVRQAAALAFGLNILGLGGLLTGTSFLAEDLGSKRFSFYFSAPVGGFSIFASRLVGAAGVLLLSTLLALLPAALIDVLFAEGGPGPSLPGRSSLAAAMVELWLPNDLLAAALLATAAACFLLGLGNALGLAGRARDAWLLVEIASLVVLGGALLASRELLDIPRSVMFEQGVLPVAAVLFGFGLLIAAAAQVIAGRTDLPRARAAFALTTAICALTIGGLAVASSRSYALPDLGDFRLSDLAGSHSYDDRWVELRAIRAFPEGLQFAFLVDRETGRSVRLDAQARYWRSDRPDSVQRSEGGRQALWMKSDASGRTHRLLRVDLESQDLRPTPTGFEHNGRLLDWKASSDGTLVGTVARIGNSRPEFGPWEHRELLQLSVERADGTGTLWTRRVSTEVPELTRVIDVSAEALRVIAVARSPIGETDDLKTVPWNTSSDSCLGSNAGFQSAHEFSDFHRRLVEIDLTPTDPTPRFRRRALPEDWWDVTIVAGPDTNLLLASASGSAALLDRESREPIWCLTNSPTDYFYRAEEVAFTLPGRRFGIWQKPRTDLSLLIVDNHGKIEARTVLDPRVARHGRRRVASVLTRPGLVELLRESSAPGSFVVRRLSLSAGETPDTPIPNDLLTHWITSSTIDRQRDE